MSDCWSMGIPDSSLQDFIDKVKSWIFWRTSNPTSISPGLKMAGSGLKFCYECETNFRDSSLKYHCQRCARTWCGNCMQDYGDLDDTATGVSRKRTEATVGIRSCKFCSDLSTLPIAGSKYSEKVYPVESPRQSPEPPSTSCGGERFDNYFPHAVSKSSMTSFSSHPSPVSFRRSPSRSDEDDGEDSANNFFCPSSEYSHDTSDVETSSFSARHEFYRFRSFGSSPSDSPSRVHITSSRVGHPVQVEQRETPRSQNYGHFDQENMAVLKRPEDLETADCIDNLSIFKEQCVKSPQPLDFENNGLIWFPPPPEDEDQETENNFFAYDDEDDENGESSMKFCLNSNADSKEPLRGVVQGHFRALVSQLLQGESVKVGKESDAEDWLDIVTAIAWQAANFVKPDTSRGGSMDPVHYVKVKCVASGSPRESILIRGIVCTKNIKHKRMTSQHRNPRLLLLGGALQFQGVSNQLESFDILRQQEMDHLKMIVSKIEALRTNVLLVEKTVSSYAQEYLLAKDISLVLNVKRTLLERIARCTGALVTPSVDKISTARLGQCELFHLEKVAEEHEATNQFNKKPSKTLMYFEGCPNRLGCTVLLKGSCREELKKVKSVIHYAVFAAYHLSLETSFLADEGASLPTIRIRPSIAVREKTSTDSAISTIANSVISSHLQDASNVPLTDGVSKDLNLEPRESFSEILYSNADAASVPGVFKFRIEHFDVQKECLSSDSVPSHRMSTSPGEIRNHNMEESEKTCHEVGHSNEMSEAAKLESSDEREASVEYYSATDTHQSILVSFSSRCVLSGTVCERSRLHRIKFYSSSDKPLGRYLQDDLFDQRSTCQSCKAPTEAHAICYTHQQGNLTINVRRVPSVHLEGEHDGKIWMWHRCMKCEHVNGIPPATRRVVMSDAAWGLSFGKFLELSFSNHVTANRVASCGHSLQRDCLRYYGCGSMIAFFRYSPIEILSVCLPPSILDFNVSGQNWLRKEAVELLSKVEALYAEMSSVLYSIDQKISTIEDEFSDVSELHNHVMELKDHLANEKSYYNDMLQPAHQGTLECGDSDIDILELNRLKHTLLIGSHVWERRLYSLDSLLAKNSSFKVPRDAALCHLRKDLKSDIYLQDSSSEHTVENLQETFWLQKCIVETSQSHQYEPTISPQLSSVLDDSTLSSCDDKREEKMLVNGENTVNTTSLERNPSAASVLSDTIDSVWTGSGHLPGKVQLHNLSVAAADGTKDVSFREANQIENIPLNRPMLPARVYSFDSAVRLQERVRRGLPPSSLHLLMVKSFHASGDYRNMIRDPVSNVQRTYSQMLPSEAQKLDLLQSNSHSFVSAASLLSDGARLMVPQNSQNDIVIAIYDNEPTSIISYALSSKEYEDWIRDRPNGSGGSLNVSDVNVGSSSASKFSTWQSFGSLDLDYIHYGGYGSEDASTTIGSIFADQKTSPHLRISFEDESPNATGKVKFSVTCYFAEQFDALRKRCCPGELDFVRSLSRCRRWSAQGGKSNVYFAKSLDERFIIKQVTKTELESFEEFAPEYFKYLKDSLTSGSPTCLAKVLGIYQVALKHVKGGKETKMDLMVMENLFFKRKISKVYDLKGSARSRYISDTTGANKVLLDMNLLETLRTKPMFLGSKAKRSLERAVWNDTSFLASVDVMDYSLLVGVDEESRELVLGIIDFMRQYTWDKHLETWVKASGILGGPKNTSPTIISPKQYKKRFRKAMTTYFLTVPDQWSS